jgi:two-component system, NtrC family, sensor kinase
VLVEASSTQLKQVILNLVTNAQHALPDGGTIEIEVAREGGWATVAVADDGPGIPPAVVTRIFDPFFTTRRDVGGTGLGLSVSLGIAQTHGGDLDVSSVPGEGATFTLRLPLAAEEVAG